MAAKIPLIFHFGNPDEKNPLVNHSIHGVFTTGTIVSCPNCKLKIKAL